MSFSLLFQDKDLEICAVNLKLEQMEAELQDLNSQESKDEASLAKIKKQLRDLEAKVKDQEEELDEQAGTIQMLEQVMFLMGYTDLLLEHFIIIFGCNLTDPC